MSASPVKLGEGCTETKNDVTPSHAHTHTHMHTHTPPESLTGLKINGWCLMIIIEWIIIDR